MNHIGIPGDDARGEGFITTAEQSHIDKCVFDLVIDYGTSQFPKSTRPLTTYWYPSRPGHPALRNNFASSLLLRTWLPYDWTPRSEAYFASPLALCARRVSTATGGYQPGATSLRFALHGWQRFMIYRDLTLGLSRQFARLIKCVFGLVIDFGTSQSPKSTRPLTTYWCPSRPGHQALRNNFASSLLLRTCLPMTGRRVRRPTLLALPQMEWVDYRNPL